CFGLVGLELASVMGDEIRDPVRTMPGAVAWGGVISGAFYIATTLILLLAIGKSDISILQGIVQAVGHMAQRVGVAWIAIQFAVSAVLVVINFAGGIHVQETFQRLLSLAVVLQLVPFLYMFAALAKFGWNSDSSGRYGRKTLLVSGVCGFVTTFLGIALVFFPAQQITSLLSYEVWMFGGTAFFVALAAF